MRGHGRQGNIPESCLDNRLVRPWLIKSAVVCLEQSIRKGGSWSYLIG
jgi:hypothetical protein